MVIIQNLAQVLIYLVAIVFVCHLFTNSIEHLGKKLNFSDSATGSILAAVGTALPETILPLIAILSCGENLKNGVEIGTGAILGSSFLLSTMSLFLAGLFFVIFNKTKLNSILNVDYKSVIRDYKFFITAYLTAVFSSFVQLKEVKIEIGIFLILFWIYYAIRTVSKSQASTEEDIDPLYIAFFKREYENSFFFIILQTLISLFLLILFSKLFVGEIQYFSVLTNINPLVISLILSPVATELPEITNSIIWIKNKKDSLAISNITGAMVYQASICCSLGLILTEWKLTDYAALGIFCTTGAIFTTLILSFIAKKLPAWIFILNIVWYLIFWTKIVFTHI